MPTNPWTREIPDEEWEVQRDAISDLYLTQDKPLQGPNGVIACMAQIGFQASKSQYETRFKKWGLRKYRNREHWQNLLSMTSQTSSRPARDVFDGAQRIPASKVRKVRARYKFSLDQASDKNLPRSMRHSVASDEIDEIEEIPRSDLGDTAPSALEPYLPLQSKVSALQDPPGTLENGLVKGHLFAQSETWTRDLPFHFFEDSIRNHINQRRLPFHGVSTDLSWVSNPQEIYPTVNMPQAVWDRILLPSGLFFRPWDIGRSLLPDDPIFKNPLSRLVLFSMANNFAGFGSIPIDKVLELLRKQSASRLSSYLYTVQGPAADALAENLFKSAIMAGNVQVVEALLDRGINANDVIVVEHQRYTPLELSAKLGDHAVTKCLIDHGADPRKSSDHNRPSKCLSNAIAYGKDGGVNSDLISTLIHGGATVTTSIVAEAVCCRNNGGFLDIIRTHYREPDCYDWIVSGGLSNLFNHSDDEEVLQLLETVFERWDVSWRDDKKIQTELGWALERATDRSHFYLTKLLLDYTKIPEQALINAIRSENRDLVQLLLDNGAVMNDAVLFAEYERNDGALILETLWNYMPVLPSCEALLVKALLVKNHEMVNLLKTRGALEPVRQEITRLNHCDSRAFEPTRSVERIMEAACKARNAPLVYALLETLYEVDSSLSFLAHSLPAAINSDGNDIVSMLYDAGISYPNAMSLVIKKNSTLLFRMLIERYEHMFSEATFRFSESYMLEQCGCDNLLRDASKVNNLEMIEKLALLKNFSKKKLGCALVAVIKQQNMESVDLLLHFGADVNKSCSQRSALLAAVCTGDEEVVSHILWIGADPADSFALFVAVTKFPALVDVLLDGFCQRYPQGKEDYGTDALYVAIITKDNKLISRLLEAHVDVNASCQVLLLERIEHSYSGIPLGEAIAQDRGTNIELVKTLLENSGNPNVLVNESWPHLQETVLNQAIGTKNIAMVKLLLLFGAKPDRPASGGLRRTPLQKAAELGSSEICHLLFDYGVDVNEPPSYIGGATALQLAAMGGYLGLVCELLRRGADVHAPPPKSMGRTAFQLAAEYGRIDVVKMLWNADTTGGRGFGTWEVERAMKLAKRNGHRATKTYIESLVASVPGGLVPTKNPWLAKYEHLYGEEAEQWRPYLSVEDND